MERFWSKATQSEGCWEWNAGKFNTGYGQFRFKGKTILAHRMAFYLTHGRWPEPQCLHSCDNKPCVRPEHLSEGTQAKNVQECVERGRQCEVKKTHCPAGHEYDRNNTAITPKGHRRCKKCHCMRVKAKYHQRKLEGNHGRRNSH